MSEQQIVVAPCPFCKWQEPQPRFDPAGPDEDRILDSGYVHCLECNAFGPDGATLAEGIESWNAAASALDAERQRAEKAEKRLRVVEPLMTAAIGATGDLLERDPLIARLTDEKIKAETRVEELERKVEAATGALLWYSTHDFDSRTDSDGQLQSVADNALAAIASRGHEQAGRIQYSLHSDAEIDSLRARIAELEGELAAIENYGGVNDHGYPLAMDISCGACSGSMWVCAAAYTSADNARRASQRSRDVINGKLSAMCDLNEMLTSERDELRGLIEASDAGPLFEQLDAQHLMIAELEHALNARPRLTREERERIAERIRDVAARQFDLKEYRQVILRGIVLSQLAEVLGPAEG